MVGWRNQTLSRWRGQQIGNASPKKKSNLARLISPWIELQANQSNSSQFTLPRFPSPNPCFSTPKPRFGHIRRLLATTFVGLDDCIPADSNRRLSLASPALSLKLHKGD